MGGGGQCTTVKCRPADTLRIPFIVCVRRVRVHLTQEKLNKYFIQYWTPFRGTLYFANNPSILPILFFLLKSLQKTLASKNH